MKREFVLFKTAQFLYVLIAVLIIGTEYTSAQINKTVAAATERPSEIESITAPFEMPQLVKPQFPDKIFNILKFGAKGDGITKNTKAFQKAIEACSAAGGGRVLVPSGKWLTGAIHLKSNVNLHFEEGAELHFSTDPEDYLPVVFTRWAGFEVYNYSPLIYANGCENIAITGPGKLFGYGEAWWDWTKRGENTAKFIYENQILKNVLPEKRKFGTPIAGLRPQFISPINCKNILFEGFTVSSPGPFWTFDIIYCENVIVRGLHLETVGGPNTDGINLNSTKNALVEYCYINAGDDCIALKSGLNEDGWRVGRPTENVVIRKITGGKTHGGIVIGSDMSGDVRNIYANDCYFNGAQIGIRLKSNASRGGIVENIYYENIRMKNIVNEAIIIETDYGAYMASENGKAFPVFRDIKFSNITCNGAGMAVTMQGTVHQPVENITLENIAIKADGGMKFNWVNGLKLINVQSIPTKGRALSFENSKNVTRESTDECPTCPKIFFTHSKKGGLEAEYFNNKNLKGEPALKRIDKQINFNWQFNSPVEGIINEDKFSVRWTGQLKAPGSGKYEIGLKADNGFRLFLNKRMIIDAWDSHQAGSFKGKIIELEKDKFYDIKIEYFENVGTSSIIFSLEKYEIKPEIAPVYYETDVKNLISIHNEADVAKVKNDLIQFIFGKDGLQYKKMPTEIEENFEDPRYKDIKSLQSITKIVVKMDFGLDSKIYHFNPKSKKNKVVLYHQGHGGDFIIAKSTIKEFLDNGYSVLAFSMPLKGMNSKPRVKLSRIGLLKLTEHNHIKFLNPSVGHPVKYFIEPIVVAINYLKENFKYEDITMVGLSGGGWATTLAAAVDSRIKNSFPVAGSYPIYLRSESGRDWGDWEQTIPELLRKSNYLEMYILGSYGKGREQVQVINKYDACCFAGTKWKTYYSEVSDRVKKLNNGDWDLWLDDTHKEHKVSEYILQNILGEIEK